jgi:3-deoxy-D-manno-octulosonic-acid transferase
MLRLYSLIYAIALFLVFPFELRKRPANLWRKWLRERFGGLKDPTSSSGDGASPLIWVHAVSVGEAIAAACFIRAFNKKHPEYRVVMSTVTDTGQKVARERLSGLGRVVYMPFDMAWTIRRAIRGLKPTIFVNMETELWPNLFNSLREAGIPVVVMNGRISEKSFRGYRKIRHFMKSVIKSVNMFCMQNEEYAGRIIELGADKENVEITGSFKFDVNVRDEVLQWTRALHGPVIVAGSTHAGEEELIVTVYRELRGRHHELNLVLAPRHPERFDEAERVLRSKGVAYVRRSALNTSGAGGLSGSVVLLDTVGELSSVYGVCDVAVIGGSFIRHGGQNPLEPAYWGKPVVCGPYMDNFPFIKEFYMEGAALEVKAEGLLEALAALIASPEGMKRMGEKARGMLMKNQGAVQKALRLVEEHIGV